jgi:hypothetical protein
MRTWLVLATLTAAPCALGCININITGQGSSSGSGSGSVTVGVGGAGSSSSSSSAGGGGAGGAGGSTSSAGGAGGTGGGVLNISDACPGLPVTLNQGAATTITGTTVGAHDDLKTLCADTDASTSAPDVVYQLGLPSPCTLSVTLHEQGAFQGAFSFRPSCSSLAGDCVNPLVSGPTLVEATQPGFYSIVVDGVNKTAGDFTLDVACAVPACGDGVVNAPSEACDGGPGVHPNDGCGDPGTPNACQVEATNAADGCSDVVPVNVSLGAPLRLPANPPPYNTTNAHDDFTSADPNCSPAPAVDQVFAFVPQADGTLDVTVGNDETGSAYCLQTPFPPGCWNHMLYARSGSCAAGTELGCAYPDYVTDNGVVSLHLAVTAGATYWVVVDGADMTVYDSGPYFLEVSLH